MQSTVATAWRRGGVAGVVLACWFLTGLAASPLPPAGEPLRGVFDMRFVGRGGASEPGAAFAVGRLALAVDRVVRPGLRLFGMFDVDDGAATVTVDEAWFDVNPVAGTLAGRFGRMPLPFTLERSSGCMRTTTWTVTPSVLGTFCDSVRLTGFEIRKGYVVPGHHFDWRIGGGSGDDDLTVYDRVFSLDEGRPAAPSRERGGRPACFAYVGKDHSNTCKRGRLAWHLGLYSGGGGDGVDDTDMALFDAQYWRRRAGFVVQGLVARSRRGGGLEQHAETSWAMGCWRFGDDLLAALRYDGWNLDDEPTGATVDRGCAWTAALTRTVAVGRLLQFEWLRPKVSVGPGLDRATQWQVRWVVDF